MDTKFSFIPTFNPGTSLYIKPENPTYYSIDKCSANNFGGGLISPVQQSRQKLPTGSRFVWIDGPKNFLSNKNIKSYIEDTYKLIKYYGDSASSFWSTSPSDYGTLAAYCHKYGMPFSRISNNFMDIGQALYAFKHLWMFLSWEKLYVDDLIESVVYIATHERKSSDTENIDLVYTPSKIAAADNKQLRVHTHKDISWQILTNNTASLVAQYQFPIFQVTLNDALLKTLTSGTQKEKSNLIQFLVMENIAKYLNQHNPRFAFYERKIYGIIDNHIAYFLYTISTNPNLYRTCLYCGELLTGKSLKYCNSDHKNKYLKSTPIGKLSGLLNKWLQRGTINSLQYEKWLNEGHILLEKYDYKTVISHFQRQKKERL